MFDFCQSNFWYVQMFVLHLLLYLTIYTFIRKCTLYINLLSFVFSIKVSPLYFVEYFPFNLREYIGSPFYVILMCIYFTLDIRYRLVAQHIQIKCSNKSIKFTLEIEMNSTLITAILLSNIKNVQYQNNTRKRTSISHQVFKVNIKSVFLHLNFMEFLCDQTCVPKIFWKKYLNRP